MIEFKFLHFVDSGKLELNAEDLQGASIALDIFTTPQMHVKKVNDFVKNNVSRPQK